MRKSDSFVNDFMTKLKTEKKKEIKESKMEGIELTEELVEKTVKNFEKILEDPILKKVVAGDELETKDKVLSLKKMR